MSLKNIHIYELNNKISNQLLKTNIYIFTNYKQLKSKFVINFFNLLAKSIFITINSTPLIIMDYIVNLTKEYRIAFTKIFGISILRCEQLKKLFGITNNKKWELKDFNKKNIFETRDYFTSTTILGFTLSKIITFEKEKFLETRCFKRNRFLLGYPANGQRTHTNGLTARKFKIKI